MAVNLAHRSLLGTVRNYASHRLYSSAALVNVKMEETKGRIIYLKYENSYLSQPSRESRFCCGIYEQATGELVESGDDPKSIANSWAAGKGKMPRSHIDISMYLVLS